MYVARERRAYILKLLEQRGHLRSTDLAQELGVTDETIRTDLVSLQQKGLLERVHGGARYILPAAQGKDTAQRLDCSMADMLAERIRAGMYLYLDTVLFSLVLAWSLREKPCHLLIASPKLLSKLGAEALPHRLYCPGGEWDKASGLISPSPETFSCLASRPPDIAILRPDAMRPDSIAYRSATRAEWARAALSAAALCYIAVPAEHLTADAPHAIPCSPDLIVTENNLPPEFHGHPAIRTLPYISLESLLPADRFDY